MIPESFFYHNKFIEKYIFDQYILDHEASWWIEIDEEGEVYPVLEIEYEINNDLESVAKVHFDLETRVNAILEIFKFAKLRNYYSEKQALKLVDLCNANEDFELGSRMTNGVIRYKARLEKERIEFEAREKEWKKRRENGL
jgi:hypothetical protein